MKNSGFILSWNLQAHSIMCVRSVLDLAAGTQHQACQSAAENISVYLIYDDK